jgi:hypothetical protein
MTEAPYQLFSPHLGLYEVYLSENLKMALIHVTLKDKNELFARMSAVLRMIILGTFTSPLTNVC